MRLCRRTPRPEVGQQRAEPQDGQGRADPQRGAQTEGVDAHAADRRGDDDAARDEGAVNGVDQRPGVSGALITTVVALMVAIPAMFGYNWLITRVREMTVEMENFAAECQADFERKYLGPRR